MIWREFKVRVPGKWVLAGEHTVLRGGAAIALPHPTCTLTLHYVPGSEPLKVLPEMAAVVLHDLIRLASEGLERRGLPFEWPKGILHIDSTIPSGAGLGSSAALSVALAKWLLPADSVADTIDFARFLENRFHGRSSGMDVTTVVLAEPILFSMEKGGVPLRLRRVPDFRFHDSGLRASTMDCVKAVQQVGVTDPVAGERLDREMRRATELALEGLQRYAEHPVEGEARIAESMRISTEVFREWGLLPADVLKKLSEVGESGAVAARVTGAGRGGFIVSLR